MDWENVLEEIEGTGQKHFESMIGYMAVIMEYIYKWEKFREEVIQNAVRVSMMPKYKIQHAQVCGACAYTGRGGGYDRGWCGPNRCSGLSGGGDVCFALGILLHFLFNSPFDL